MAALGTLLRQGDILAVAVDGLPDDAEPVAIQPTSRFALSVGHDGTATHLVTTSPEVRAFRKSGGPAVIQWFQVGPGGLNLTHPQHDALFLEPGNWLIVRQREYRPPYFDAGQTSAPTRLD